MSLYQKNIDERVALAMVNAKLEQVKKQVQCADCLKWINADKNHICKEQIRRNRKGGA